MRLVVTALLVVAVVLVPFGHQASFQHIAFAQDASSATTTDTLNLRSTASTSSIVVRVMPRGVTVTIRGAASNGFLPVSYDGSQGWAHKDYLAVAKPSGTPATTGTVTEPLNLRQGPSTGHPALLVIPAGASVTITGTSSNNFLAITYAGYNGYVHMDWVKRGASSTPVKPAPVTPTPQPTVAPVQTTGTGRVTEELNMRAQPNTTSAVLAILPTGANLKLTGKTSGQFLQITYNGKTGWAHKSWIRVTKPVSAQPTPTPTPAPSKPVTTVTGTARVKESLNLRSQATTTSSVLIVMPANARVSLTGKKSGLFHQVTYNGKTGWAHQDWIELDQATVKPTNTAVVTVAVNLRGGPAMDYKRITVVRAGAVVMLTGQQSNGFHSISYNGTSGWVFSTYLQLDQAGRNVTVVPPGSVSPEPDRYPAIQSDLGFHYTNAIVGPVRGTPEQAIEYARRSKSLHIKDVELYIKEVYRLAPTIGFDPALIVAQSALETGNWKSDWWKNRLNPAGLGLNDDKSTHKYSAKFPNGTIAARAQLAHMHAEVYGNRQPLPKVLQGTDATYEKVFQAGWAGTIVTLDDLAGTWATDPQYGWKISRVASNIFG